MKKIFLSLILSIVFAFPAFAETASSITTSLTPYTTGSFGDEVSQTLDKVVAGSWHNGINTNLFSAGTPLNSATVDVSNNRLRLQTGTNAAGAAAFISKRPIVYREGQGSVVRFTAAFTTCVANSEQYIGVANYTASASNTAFIDGYVIGCNGASFGVLHRNNSSDSFTAQASFNLDLINGSGSSAFNVDYTKGNVYQISYPYLGYGTVTFSVQNPKTGLFIPFHRIRYPNTTTTTQLSNPNLSLYAVVANSGNTTNLTLLNGSMAGFVVGEQHLFGDSHAFSNRKTNITTRTNVFTLKSSTNLNGVKHTGTIRIRSCSFACDAGNDTCLFDIVRNTTLGGTPSFAAVDGTTADSGVSITGNSSVSADTAGTTVTGGKIEFNAAAARNTGYQIDLTPFDIFLYPTETMTFAITGDASLAGRVSCNWDDKP
jgi:hypothetical protein